MFHFKHVLCTYVRVDLIVGADNLPLDRGREYENEGEAEHDYHGHRPPRRPPPQPPDPLADETDSFSKF